MSAPEAVTFYGSPTLRNFHRWRLRPDPLRPHVTWHLNPKALNPNLMQVFRVVLVFVFFLASGVCFNGVLVKVQALSLNASSESLTHSFHS